MAGTEKARGRMAADQIGKVMLGHLRVLRYSKMFGFNSKPDKNHWSTTLSPFT